MSRSEYPHIIFILCDELRADALAFAGNEVVRTPNLDALAADSMVFTDAYCTSPMCCPSRASLATGRYPLSHGVLDNGCLMMDDEDSLYDAFRRAGYRTANVGKWHVNAPGRDFGMDQNVTEVDCVDAQTSCWGIPNRELRRQAAYTKIPGAISLVIHGRRPVPADETVDSLFTERFLHEIDRSAASDTPAFLRLSLFDPHSPYMPADPYAAMYDPDRIALPANFRAPLDGKPILQRVFHDVRGFDRLSETDYRRALACYYGLISHVDDRVGKVIDKLRTLGLYDDAIVVFTADHGAMMGEHGYIEKWGHMYEQVSRIPLLVKLPGRDARTRRSSAFVENLDTLPTLMDYLGVPVARGVQGRSFLRVLTGEASEHRDEVHGMIYCGGFQTEPALMIRDRRWKFTRYGDQEHVEMGLELDHPLRLSSYFDGDPVAGELYDLDADPYETHNLFGVAAYARVQADWERQLISWVHGMGAIADYRSFNGGQNRSAFYRLAQSDSVRTVNAALTRGKCSSRFMAHDA